METAEDEYLGVISKEKLLCEFLEELTPWRFATGFWRMQFCDGFS